MPNELSLPPVAAELGEALRAYQAAVDDFDREVARLLGINTTDLRCLEILLQERSKATPGTLATFMGLSSGAVTSMLDRLERAGLVDRMPHPTDRRKTIVRATPAAAERTRLLLAPLLTEGARHLLSRYTDKDLELLVDFTRRSHDLQQRHVERLRSMPTNPPT